MGITCESSIAKRPEILFTENKFHCILFGGDEKRVSYLRFERSEQEKSLRFIQRRSEYLFLHLWMKEGFVEPTNTLFVIVVIRDSERKCFFAKKSSENEDLFRSNIIHRVAVVIAKSLPFDSWFLRNAFRSKNVVETWKYFQVLYYSS